MKKIFVFVVMFFISLVFLPNEAMAYERGKVVGDFVSVRSSVGGSVLTKVIYGTYVEIIEESGFYYKVIYDGLNTGYMSKDYVKKDNEYKATDDNYCKSLMELGFPESYCPYLTYIHQKHPTWTFTPLVTNLDYFSKIVDGEEGKNCIQSTNDAYRASSKVCDAGGFYYVNQAVNAYMLDPRNFLMEKTIFMFEDLGYSERAENKSIVTNIFGEKSYLNTELDTDGSSYVDYFLDAGKTYSVSPVHLAARTKQEGGANSTYGPITGTVTSTLEEYGNRTLYGYYNYFNIGATSSSNPQLKGLAYAAGYSGTTGLKTSYGRPWDSRKKAIYGGANFISSSYISKGQSTLYFQKFNTNVNGSNSLFTNQYMTNIFAPYSEGANVKSSYEKNDILDIAYNFVIPVYSNMPAETYQPSLLSSNNLLSGIYINGELISGFDADIIEYSLYYLDTVTSVNISAISNSADAKVEGVGEISLANEDNKIVIKVTAQNGETKEYVINIKRVKDTTTVEEVINKLGVKTKDGYIYGISVNTAVSTVIASVQSISPSAEASIVDANGNKKVEGAIATGDKLILKTLTSAQATYDIAINGDVNGDALVDIKDLLRVQKHLLGTSNLSGIYNIAADNNYDNNLNVQDLLRIQKHILGSITL